MMTTLRKLSALLLAAALMLPAFACANNNSSEGDTADLSSSSSDADTPSEGSEDSGVDFQIDDPSATKETDDKSADSKDAAATTAKKDSQTKNDDPDDAIVTDVYGQRNNKLVFNQPTPEQEMAANNNQPVITTRRGSDGTYYIQQTDINGAAVTQANGEAQTEVYTGTTVAADYSEPDYVPDQRTYQAYWLDISERKDFVFDGNLLEFEVEVAEDAPDGVYPIEVYFTDFSNYDAKSLENIACRPGYLCINSNKPAETALNNGQITLTPDTFEAKPGDTVKMNVRIDNNPGIVAFVVRMHYDAKVMTITDAGAGSDLGELAPLTASPMAD